MGRKYNPIPIPIHYRRQYILSLMYIAKYTKSMVNRNFDDRIAEAFENIFTSNRNFITKNIADDVKYLSEARFYSHLR
jgi:ribosomal protein S7